MLRLVLLGASSADKLGPPDKRAIFYCTLPDRRNENTFPVSSVIIGDPCGQAMYAPGEHPEQHLANYAGLMQADAYAGFNELYEPSRHPGRIVEAACWAQTEVLRPRTVAEGAYRDRGDRPHRCDGSGESDWRRPAIALNSLASHA